MLRCDLKQQQQYCRQNSMDAVAACRLEPVLTFGVFPCLHYLARPPWSFRLKT